MKHLLIGSIALAGIGLSGCTMAPAEPAMPAMAAKPATPAMTHYHAMLAPAAGVTSTGKGMGMFMYMPGTHQLSWEVTYQGLTGPAVAAHIHGPADPGANAGPVVPLPVSDSPMKGSATLTDAQAAELAAGKYYVNVHTAANKGGEIRGQIMAQ